MTKTELKQLIEDNIETYKDFDDFKKYMGFTREDVKNELYDGLFSELTPCKGETILSVLKEEVTQNSFLALEQCLNETDLDNQTNLNDIDALIRDYLKMYSVFYIKSEKRYFADFD